MPLLIVQDLLITPSIGSPTHKLFSVYSETAVGVEESAGPAMQVRAFPSPADDAVTIAWTDGAEGVVQVELVDAAGAVVRTHQLTPNGAGPQREQLPMSDLPAGVYLVLLRSRDAVSTTQLVVLH